MFEIVRLLRLFPFFDMTDLSVAHASMLVFAFLRLSLDAFTDNTLCLLLVHAIRHARTRFSRPVDSDAIEGDPVVRGPVGTGSRDRREFPASRGLARCTRANHAIAGIRRVMSGLNSSLSLSMDGVVHCK